MADGDGVSVVDAHVAGVEELEVGGLHIDGAQCIDEGLRSQVEVELVARAGIVRKR